MPKCKIQAARVDALIDQQTDCLQSAFAISYRDKWGFDGIDDELAQSCKNKIASEIIPKNLDLIEKSIQQGETTWIAGTDKPSIADFHWAGVLPAIEKGAWTGDEL